MALTENQSFPIVVYTDSWAVFRTNSVDHMWKGLLGLFMGENCGVAQNCGSSFGQWAQEGNSHWSCGCPCPLISPERLYNQQADLIAAVREINLEEAFVANEDLCTYAEVNVIEPSLISLARWAHETSGHMGTEKTYQWCHQRCIPVTIDIVKQIVNNCSTCTEVKQWPLQKKATGKLKRGMGPGQIWQVDYIGPLPRENRLLYALTAVDTYSGLLQAYPSTRADQKATLNGLSQLIQAYGVPEEIQSDQGSHFAGRDVQEWAQGAGIQWTLHIPYHPQAAGLIERMNGLLKEQVKKLTGHNHLKGWTKVLKQALFNLNNRPLAGSTPFMRHQNVGGEPPVCALRLTTISPLANNELTPTGLLVRAPKSLTIKLNSSERLSLGITGQWPKEWEVRINVEMLVTDACLTETLEICVNEWYLALENQGSKDIHIAEGQAICKLHIDKVTPVSVSIAQFKGEIGGKVWVLTPGQKSRAGEIIAAGPGDTRMVLLTGSQSPLCFPLHRLSSRVE
ncbi:uncharacterized protein LOC120522266 [Polypterus senegalus]|uniref:uncharacterized protein LOC120522266 n=1 Tax=Polypterus senegalus TaxID=55291 RepID=UPI0019664FFD|nr:uncharacterized protein LOC120522266 [Polypterus senegalus]